VDRTTSECRILQTQDLVWIGARRSCAGLEGDLEGSLGEAIQKPPRLQGPAQGDSTAQTHARPDKYSTQALRLIFGYTHSFSLTPMATGTGTAEPEARRTSDMRIFPRFYVTLIYREAPRVGENSMGYQHADS
jgi:hypothetical protein